jgi:hypothetical protein
VLQAAAISRTGKARNIRSLKKVNGVRSFFPNGEGGEGREGEEEGSVPNDSSKREEYGGWRDVDWLAVEI